MTFDIEKYRSIIDFLKEQPDMVKMIIDGLMGEVRHALDRIVDEVIGKINE